MVEGGAGYCGNGSVIVGVGGDDNGGGDGGVVL